MSNRVSTKTVLTTSLAVDFLDLLLNMAIAILTGSAVMAAESLQGGADLVTSGLLVVGLKRSHHRADTKHRFGYGREIYFWTLMSGLFMLAITASFSFAFGWQRFWHPQPIHSPWLALIVLVFGVFSNSYALSLSYRRLRRTESDDSIWEIFSHSTLIEIKAAFALDLIGTVSAVFGLMALGLYYLTGNPVFDGLGAMVIGISIASLGLLLVLDVKDLLIGRSATPELIALIEATTINTKGVKEVRSVQTMYIGSEALLVNIALIFEPNLTRQEIERRVEQIKTVVQTKVPSVRHIQIDSARP